eukprot:TRINITY_DN786_c0_g1_i8.p1 TRINITY_DN786_c0_g1~~TRINITY_DN786_c0_g1_i8.p1  ORF type:complete len:1132 (+),score=124.07 TRINITY_DN786_c0_g1_i8:119-3397(+)
MWTCILFNLASILACQRPPFPNQSLSPHVQPSLPFPQLAPYHRPSLAAISPRVSYTRDQLLSVPPATLDPSVVDAIRGVGIGRHLPRVRTHRAGRRKQRRIGVVCGTRRNISTDHASTVKSVNFDNLIRVPLSCFSPDRSTHVSLSLFNAQSVGPRPKRSAINEHLLSTSTDILCLTETWLRGAGDEPKCRDLAPPGYSTVSFPRATTTCGGGIAFVVSDKLLPHTTFSSTFPFNHASFELSQLSLSLPQSHLNVFCLYRPPPNKKNKLSDAMFIEQLPEFLEYANSLPGSLLIVGDFNFHFDSPTQFYTSKVIDIISMFNLSQSVTEPTHNRGHIVDWVLFRDDDCLLKSTAVDQTLSSDHHCVTCHLNLSKPPTARVYREVRRLTSIDIETFKADLRTDLPSEPTPDQLSTVLRAVLDRHAPPTRRPISNRPPSPWYNAVGPELLEAKQERRRAERHWRSTRLTIYKQIFQTARNCVTDIVDNAKSRFYSSKILACTTAKQLFTFTNNLLGKVNSSPLPIVFSVHELPQKFSDFFTSKISLIREKLDAVVPPFSSVTEREYSGPALHCFEPVSEEFVKKVCLSSGPKSCELDPVPSALLFECLDVLLPYMTHVINSSLLSGCFPDIYKSSVIRPLIKKPSLDHNCLNNYRPVSNLSFLSKLLERIVLFQLFSHLEQNHLLNSHQSAYRRGHSCETALLRIVNDLLLGFDNDKISVLALLDLSAAFDTIDHSILLTRLKTSFGIRDTALAWITSYLTDRTQKVCVNGKYSDVSALKYGVPQGSVLGPVLFVLYSAPVSDVISHHAMLHESFADDTQLHQSASIADIDALMSRTQECIADLKDWMTLNKLKLNDDKTELMLACPRKFLQHPSLPDSILINDTTVSSSSSVRSLGVILDQSLSFQKHISNVCKVTYLELRRISSIRHYLSTEATKTLVCAFVLSRIDYCNSLLAGLPKYMLDRLQRIQNNAARLICRAPKSDHVSPLLHSLHWLPVSKRIDYKLSTLTFSAVSGSGPEYLSDLLHIYTPSRQLRSSSDTRLLRIPHVRTKTYGQRSFSHQAPTTWNRLPDNLRHSDSLASFKSGLKTHLFSQQ